MGLLIPPSRQMISIALPFATAASICRCRLTICSVTQPGLGDDFAPDFGGPQLDLIQPRGIGESEVEPDTWILLEELLHQCSFVSGEIIEDDLDVLVWEDTE